MNLYSSSFPLQPAAPIATPAAPFDPLSWLNTGIMKPLLEGWARTAMNVADAMGQAARASVDRPLSPARGRCACHRCGCSPCTCAPCHCSPCHCRCCIVDADLVLYARLGETHVVPLHFENPWRRERKVKLSLGEWRRLGGAPGPIRATFLPPAPEFTLAPCGYQTVVMVVEAGKLTSPAEAPIDVDDSTVFYADLTVEGCDIRPVRTAVALVPRDCDGYRIDCGCGCC